MTTTERSRTTVRFLSRTRCAVPKGNVGIRKLRTTNLLLAIRRLLGAMGVPFAADVRGQKEASGEAVCPALSLPRTRVSWQKRSATHLAEVLCKELAHPLPAIFGGGRVVANFHRSMSGHACQPTAVLAHITVPGVVVEAHVMRHVQLREHLLQPATMSCK